MSLTQVDSSHVESLLLSSVPDGDASTDYGCVIPNSAKEGYSSVYINQYLRDNFDFQLLEKPHPSLSTYYELFSHSVAINGDKPGFGVRSFNIDGSRGNYEWETYRQIDTVKRSFGSGLFYVLINNPFQPTDEIKDKILYRDEVYGKKEESFIVSIFSSNRREWAITDLACVNYSVTNTALYDTLGPNTTNYILALTKSPVIVCSKDKLKLLIELKNKNPKDLINLTTLVSMDPLDLSNPASQDYGLLDSAKSNNLMLYDFNQVVKLGELNLKPDLPPTPDSIYSISFTSGTTGSNPKGVVLTHRNGVASATFCLLKYARKKDTMKYYNFLPLAHIYERMNLNFALFRGFEIGFPSTPTPTSLMDDVKVLKPHTLLLVPRVLTKLEAAIKAQTVNNSEKPLLQKLFRRAVDYKIQQMSSEDGNEGHHIIYDRLIGLLRKKMGFENIYAFSSGSAPIAPDSIKFLKAVLNIGMAQGYGLTESFAGVCSSPQHEANPGTCGAPSFTCMLRVKEVPEMNYTAADEGGPRGELQIKGPQIFKEYYKNPEETASSLSPDGWFSTGDIAKIDEVTGRVSIIDRVKNFFKLAQGEYITPEKIENTYLSCFPLVSQIFVHGESTESYLVGIIGVDSISCTPWLAKNFKITAKSDKELLEHMNKPEIKLQFLTQMNGSTKTLLQGFEKLHNLRFDIEPLKLEDDIITPTLKIKRPLAKKFFKLQLDELYQEGSLLKSGSRL